MSWMCMPCPCSVQYTRRQCAVYTQCSLCLLRNKEQHTPIMLDTGLDIAEGRHAHYSAIVTTHLTPKRCAYARVNSVATLRHTACCITNTQRGCSLISRVRHAENAQRGRPMRECNRLHPDKHCTYTLSTCRLILSLSICRHTCVHSVAGEM